MENASKGLLIAGGMLLAIITISVFILGYSNINKLAQANIDDELREEIERFNKPYLAFNKNVMYGSDVISILNFAISNNKMNNVKAGEDFYVDVSFKLKTAIADTVYKYTLNEGTGTYSSEILKKEQTKYGAGNFSFETNKTYSLSNNYEAINAFLQTANRAEETKTVTNRKENIELEYTITYSGIAEFKRKTFKCSEVKYDSYGKVNYMKFEQI